MAGEVATAPIPTVKRGPGRPPKTQVTAPAPASTASTLPAPSVATGNKEAPTAPPAASVKAKATPSKGMATAGENAPPTFEKTNMDFEAGVRAFEEGDKEAVREGKAEKGKPAAEGLKSKADDKTKERDIIQEELDAAAAAEGLKVKGGEEESEKKEEAKPDEKPDSEKEEVEAPEVTDKDAYDKWIGTLSKPAAKKIEQQRKKIGELNALAAERITVTPTLDAPLSHVTNLEQLDAEKTYWKNIRETIRKGEVLKITGSDGKKTELDPDVPDDAEMIERYGQWAEAALDAVPDAKDRINKRLSSKPWDTAERLAPGMITDKESYAQKTALALLQTVPELKLRSPDYEVHLAHMVRSMQMDEDAKPTEAYPKGRAKWVRLALDKDGNVVPPKKAASSKPAQKPPTASDNKPAVQKAAATPAIDPSAVQLTDDDFRSLVASAETRRSA